MADGRRNPALGKSISIPGLLSLMGGVGLFYCYFMFRWSLELGSFGGRIFVLGCASLFVLWGVYEIVGSLFSSYHGRRSRRRGQPEVSSPRFSQRLRGVASLVMMAGGTGLGLIIAIRADSSLTVMLAITLGVLMFVGGLRSFVTILLPTSAESQGRRLQRLPFPGAAYLTMMSVFFVGSLIGRSNMLMLVFALMAGPFVMNGWMTLRMLALTRVSRALPRHIMAGEMIDVDVIVRNNKTIMSSWLLDVTDRIVGNDEELQTGVLFTRVPPGEERRVAYRLRLMQRGKYRFGPLVVRSRFPLGFAERGLTDDRIDEVIVYPRLGQLTRAWDQETVTATELVETQNSRAGIYDDEFHRLREFRWGDNPRAIHWRTSARRNEMMVREYHQSRDCDLFVLLDLWLPRNPKPTDWERVELAVSFVATICIDHMRNSRDSVVTVTAVGRETRRWQGQAGPSAYDSLLEMLALLQPNDAPKEAPLPSEFGQPGNGSRSAARRSLLITTAEQRIRKGHGSQPVALTVGRPSPNRWSQQFDSYVADPETLTRYFVVPAPSGG